jgi:UDP-N-acetylmuramoylalanine--D-glutamate ligase
MVNKKSMIVGLGKTGLSVANYLIHKNKPFILFDDNIHCDVTIFREKWPDALIFLETFPTHLNVDIDEVIVSPGVNKQADYFTFFKETGVPIIGDIECFAREVTVPVVAITGTNGKSTVTTLVGELLKASGREVVVAGNIGLPVLDAWLNYPTPDIFVLELSSFQLSDTYTLKPAASTILNITEDHLDKHKDMNDYIHAKHRIYLNSNWVVYNDSDPLTYPKLKEVSSTAFSLNKPKVTNMYGIIKVDNECMLSKGKTSFYSMSNAQLKGGHMMENMLASVALCEPFDIPVSIIDDVFSHYQGLPHRTQWIRTIDNIEFFDDSKGTNVGATIAAIQGLSKDCLGKIILIAGGMGKGADFSPLKPIIEKYVSVLILIGKDAPHIELAMDGCVQIEHVVSMKDAVYATKCYARPHDRVLLSPACASMDMFKDYHDRGNQFIKWVNTL